MTLNKGFFKGTIRKMEVRGSDEHKALFFLLSVRETYKKPEDQYYPTFLLPCTAFGSRAEVIMNHFTDGDEIIVEGNFSQPEYTDEDGTVKRSNLQFKLTDFDFCGRKNGNCKDNDEFNDSDTVEPPKMKSQTKPSSPKTAFPKPGAKPQSKTNPFATK